MNISYEIISTNEKVVFYKDSIDEVISILNENNSEEFTVKEVKRKDISKIVTNLRKSEETMKKIREKNREGELNSFFMKNDFYLPYVFDLCHDIKTEGELAKEFKEGPSDSLIELALEYGYTETYLMNLDIKGY